MTDLASFQCGLCATPHIRDLLFAREMITASDNTVLLFSGPALRQWPSPHQNPTAWKRIFTEQGVRESSKQQKGKQAICNKLPELSGWWGAEEHFMKKRHHGR